MFNKTDFENIVWDFLFTYRQFLLNGYLHKRVNHDVYEANTATWNTLLLSLESGALLGLAKLLERKDDLGRPFNGGLGKTFNNEEFNNEELNGISEKIINLRHAYIAHADLSKMRDINSFLTKNRLTGTDIVKMFDALKSRLIQYQKSLKLDVDVQKLFTESQNSALHDLNSWLKSFNAES
ncbi:MAG: hypothetical protein HYY86_00285 [Candidatus Harrisonbacteria bacterium]|nr:hypothetical protein [Candidatus Harrisonbacteria bacterium]